MKQFNDKRIQEGGKYTIPKKGTPEYASVRELMGEKSDAVALQPNQTVTGQSAPGKSTGKPRDTSKSRSPKKTDSEEKIHKAVQTLVPTKDKPLWVDEPKPVEKTAKKNQTSYKSSSQTRMVSWFWLRKRTNHLRIPQKRLMRPPRPQG